jgi:hypothetical protein
MLGHWETGAKANVSQWLACQSRYEVPATDYSKLQFRTRPSP